MMPRLGIVVPSRNAAATIGSTLGALREIPGVEADVIVVDGHSEDGTADLASAMGARVVARAPAGIYDAINAGLEAVEGEWLTYINADDILYVDGLAARLVGAANHDVTYGPVDFVDAAGCHLHRWHSARPAHLLCLYRAGMSPLLQQGTVFRREVFRRLRGFDTRWQLVADADFWFRAAEQGFRFQRTTAASVAAFRMHPLQAGRLRADESRREHATMIASHRACGAWPGMAAAWAWRAGNWRSYLRRLSRIGGGDLRNALGSYATGAP